MTQLERVHERLKQGPLTALGAFRELGIMRLAPRILELRQQGIGIVSKTVRRHGKSYAEYRLEV